MNYPEEKCFGVMTRQMHCFGQSGLIHATAVARVLRNGNLSRVFDAHSKKKSGQMGKNHNISNKIQLYL